MISHLYGKVRPSLQDGHTDRSVPCHSRRGTGQGRARREGGAVEDDGVQGWGEDGGAGRGRRDDEDMCQEQMNKQLPSAQARRSPVSPVMS